MVKAAFGASLAFLAAAWAVGSAAAGGAQAEEKVDYRTQIRPILSEYCYECHGPEKDESGLRLDSKESAFVELDGLKILVPGDPDDSELYLRISAEFPEERMPPYEAGTYLTDEEIETIRQWIEQGAEWEDD